MFVPGPYTVLAPINSALAMVDPDLMVQLGRNTLLLKTVIQYHILSGFTLIPELKPGMDEVTLNGQSIAITSVNNVSVITPSCNI